jgi:hypothetical protein
VAEELVVEAHDLRTHALDQRGRAHHEVLLAMGLDDVLDGEVVLLGHRDVLFNVAPRINDGRFAVISNQIGDVGDARGLELPEKHRRPPAASCVGRGIRIQGSRHLGRQDAFRF